MSGIFLKRSNDLNGFARTKSIVKCLLKPFQFNFSVGIDTIKFSIIINLQIPKFI